jgi:hypothetical protein
MGIFPSDYNEKFKYKKESKEVPLLKEYNIDFDTGQILVDGKGKFEIVEGLEAIKVRVWLAFKIKRGRWFIYPNVGTHIDTLPGEDLEYWNRNIEEILRQGLIDNVYITDIQDINIIQEKDIGTIEFTVISIYGNYETEYTERIGA